MAMKKGVCHNFGECDLADSKEIQEADEHEFVCEECGKPLFEIGKVKPTPSSGKGKLIALIAAAVLILGGGGYFAANAVKEKKQALRIEKEQAIQIAKEEADKLNVAEDFVSQIEKRFEELGEVSAEDRKLFNDAIGKLKTAISEKDFNGIDKFMNETSDVLKLIKPIEPVKPQPVVNTSDSRASNTMTLSYGTYTGSVKNGYPHGQGKLVFSKDRQINSRDSKKRMAKAGDYVVGEFVNGFFVNGRHYNSKGELQSTIIIGHGSDAIYESK